MQISDLDEGEMGRIVATGKEFLVIERWPEDRGSGITDVHFISGGSRRFVWDHEDPEVVKIGRGELKVVKTKESG